MFKNCMTKAEINTIKSVIMREAHKIRSCGNLSMSEALKLAWAWAKNGFSKLGFGRWDSRTARLGEYKFTMWSKRGRRIYIDRIVNGEAVSTGAYMDADRNGILVCNEDEMSEDEYDQLDDACFTFRMVYRF